MILIVRLVWCRERDLNPHPIARLAPQASAYANSAIAARDGIKEPLNHTR
jgi:hypothetical protein